MKGNPKKRSMDTKSFVLGLTAGAVLVFAIQRLSKFGGADGKCQRTDFWEASDTWAADELKKRVLVVARTEFEDVAWLDDNGIREIPHVIYDTNATSASPAKDLRARHIIHQTKSAKGGEAMAYLQYIIDFYNNLPETVVFLHASSYHWHLKNKVSLLKRLQWGKHEFANVRYAPSTRLDWICADKPDPSKLLFSCHFVGLWVLPSGFVPLNRSEGYLGLKETWVISEFLSQAWVPALQSMLGPPPLVMHSPCCGEFLVSRSRIRAHPRDAYIHLRDWIVGNDLNLYTTVSMLEVVWHMIFGEPPILDPVFECDLLTCDALELEAATKELGPWKAEQEADTAKVLANLGDLGSMDPKKLLDNLRNPKAKKAWSWQPDHKKAKPF